MNKTLFGGLLLALAMNVSAGALNNLYVGVGLGTADLDDDGYFVGLQSDDSDYSTQLFIGYNLDQYIALEAGLSSLGEYDQSSSDADLETAFGALTFAAVGHFPLSQQFSLDGRLGLGLYSISQDIAYINGNGNLDVDDETEGAIGFVYGLGFTVNPATLKSFLFRFSWERHDFSIDTVRVTSSDRRSDDADMEIDTFTAAVAYKF